MFESAFIYSQEITFLETNRLNNLSVFYFFNCIAFTTTSLYDTIIIGKKIKNSKQRPILQMFNHQFKIYASFSLNQSLFYHADSQKY